jgi:hypothetical protein
MIVYGRLPKQPFVSVAVIVKVKVPATVGVPERITDEGPPGLSERPVGSVPLETVKMNGAFPPTAVMV